MLNPDELKYELYDHYTDQDRLVTIDKNPGKWSTGNGLMHLGLSHVLFKALNIQTFPDTYIFKEAVLACEVPNNPGSYYRNPGRTDDNRQDDLIGVSAGSVATNSTFHKDIEEYAWKNLFIWNLNNDLTWGDFLGRHVFRMLALLLNTGKACYLPFLPLLVLKHLLKRDTDYSVLLDYMEIESLYSFVFPKLKFVRNYLVPRIGLSMAGQKYFNTQEHPVVGLLKHAEISS